MLLLDGTQWSNPKTWPRSVWIAIAFTSLNFLRPLWTWWRQRRAEAWPIISAQTESTFIEPPSSLRLGIDPRSYLAQIHYSYLVKGERCSGTYQRECGTNKEALDFLRALENQPTTVHYDPQAPCSSYMDEGAVELLLQRRNSIPDSETCTAKTGDRVPAWLAPFLAVFLVAAAVGVLISVWVHLTTLSGRTPELASLMWMLHFGVLIVSIPAILITLRRIGGAGRRTYWRVALKGAPDWMRYVVYATLGYAALNFFFFMLSSNSSRGLDGTTVQTWKLFSGHWIAGYCVSFALLYSALSSRRSETS